MKDMINISNFKKTIRNINKIKNNFKKIDLPLLLS